MRFVHKTLRAERVTIRTKDYWIEDHIARRVPMKFNAAACSAEETEAAHSGRGRLSVASTYRDVAAGISRFFTV